MEIREFRGKSDKRSKLRMLAAPVFLLGLAGFWLFSIHSAAPELLEFSRISTSLILAMPFYIGMIAFDSIKKTLFKKSHSVFDISYQVSERYVDVKFFDRSLSIKITDLEEIRNPEYTGQFMHFVLKGGKEYSLPVPDNKLELYQLLCQRIT